MDNTHGRIEPVFPNFISCTQNSNSSDAQSGSNSGYRKQKKKRYRLKNIIQKQYRIGINSAHRVSGVPLTLSVGIVVVAGRQHTATHMCTCLKCTSSVMSSLQQSDIILFSYIVTYSISACHLRSFVHLVNEFKCSNPRGHVNL